MVPLFLGLRNGVILVGKRSWHAQAQVPSIFELPLQCDDLERVGEPAPHYHLPKQITNLSKLDLPQPQAEMR